MSDPHTYEYELLGRDPHAWVRRAHTLLQAEELVLVPLSNTFPGGTTRDHPTRRRDQFLMEPYLLLSGYAIELLLKAVLLVRRPEIVVDGTLLSKAWTGKGTGHALQRLADEADLDRSPDEDDLLVRLEAFITWSGRYPVPTKSSSYPRRDGDSRARTFTTTDPKLIAGLAAKLEHLVASEA